MSYVLLRGSRLSAEDKKRVLVESGAEQSGQKLEWKKVVAAIRMLGSAFFQDYTGAKREKTLKTYDHMAFNVDEVEDEYEHEAYWANDDPLDEDTLAQLVNKNDEDAAMVVQFEEAITEAVQNNTDLAAYFPHTMMPDVDSTERAKLRGVWSVKKGGKNGGKKGFGKGPGKGKSLAQRIANSTCRLCGKKGHWKAECSLRSTSSTAAPSSEGSGVPISLAVVDDMPDDLPPEIFHLLEMTPIETLPKNMEECFGVVCGDTMGSSGNYWGNKQDVMERLQTALRSELGIRQNRDALKPKHPCEPRFSVSHMHDAHRHPASQ